MLGRKGVEGEGPPKRHLGPDPHLGALDIGPYEFQGKFVWTNGPFALFSGTFVWTDGAESSSKVSP